MTSTMLNRLTQLGSASPSKSRAYIGMDAPGVSANETFTSSVPEAPLPDSGPDYRFSVGQLPVWAKKQIRGNKYSGENVQNSDQPVKGRWAQRVGGQQVTVKSHYEDDSVIPFPGGAASSSGATTRRQEGSGAVAAAAKEAAVSDKNNQSEHDADADIDEYSDNLTMNEDGGESTEPEHAEKTLFFGQSKETPR